MRRFFLILLFCCPVFALTVTSPTASQTISGYTGGGFAFAVDPVTVPTGTCSMEWYVNGEAQGIVRLAPWSLPWNTFNVFNSGSAWHWVYAIARGCDGSMLATSANVFFSVRNTGEFEGFNYLLMNLVTASGGTNCSALTTYPVSNPSIGGTCTLTFTFNGSASGNQKNYTVLVNGNPICSGNALTGVSFSCNVDTTRFLNGLGVFRIMAFDNNGTGTAFTGRAYPLGEWAERATFSNGHTPMALLLGPQEDVTAPGSTSQLSCTLIYTDSDSPVACSSPAYSSSIISVATVHPTSGLMTGVAFGYTQITASVTSPVALSRTRVKYVSSSNILPHLGLDGAVHTSYTPGQSFFFSTDFINAPLALFSDPLSTYAQTGAALSQAGHKVVAGGPLLQGDTCQGIQSTFTAAVTAFATNVYNNILAPFNFRYHFFNSLNTPTDLYNCDSPGSVGQSYAPHAWTLIANIWNSVTGNKLIGYTGIDETSYAYITSPNLIGTVGQFSSGLVSLTNPGGGSTLWTVNWTIPEIQGGGQPIAIFGATCAHNTGSTCAGAGGFDDTLLNTTPGADLGTSAHSRYTPTGGSLSLSGYTFTGPAVSGAPVTISSVTDPSLHVEPFLANWFSSTGYIPANVFANILSDLHAASPPAITTNPAAAQGENQFNTYMTMGDPTVADWATIYTDDAGPACDPRHFCLTNFLSMASQSVALMFRQSGAYLLGPKALIGKGEAILNLNVLGQHQGFSTAITGIVGRLVTFANPVCPANIAPNVTRMTITSSANSYFNGDFYIDRCPTPYTAKISRNVGTNSGADGVGGAARFENGDTVAQNPGPRTPSGGGLLWTSGTPTFNQAVCDHMGEYLTYLTVGGGNAAYYNNNTFYYVNFPIRSSTTSWLPGANNFYRPCPWGATREVPPDSQISGSATAQVIPSDDYVNGRDTSLNGVVSGPRASHISDALIALYGGSGSFHYATTGNTNATNGIGVGNICWPTPTANCAPTLDTGGVIQQGIQPRWDNGENGLVQGLYGTASIDLLADSMARRGYLYQPRFGAPDIGANIEASLRKGSKGSLLLVTNVQDWPQTVTVDLSGSVVGGQPTIVYPFDWTGIGAIRTISAGTTTDTVTLPAGGSAWYLCSLNAAAEYTAPTKSFTLPSGAASIKLHFGYDPVSIYNRTDNVIDCTSTCSVPVDTNIGTVYIWTEPLQTDGTPLVTGPIVVTL